jgi:hypothetical protein
MGIHYITIIYYSIRDKIVNIYIYIIQNMGKFYVNIEICIYNIALKNLNVL